MIYWLYQTTIELSLLLVLVLFLRPVVRRLLGSQNAYYLWLIPLLGVLFGRPQRPISLDPLELIISTGAQFQSRLYSSIDTEALSDSFPWAGLWLVGIFLWSAMRIIKAVRFQQLLEKRSNRFDSESSLYIGMLAHFRHKPELTLTTSLPGAPFVSGFIIPKLFLPNSFSEKYSAKEQRWILLHELTHLKRHDLFVKFIVEWFRALFWFNPLMHIAAYFIQHDQELACDQEVLSSCGKEERYQYGKALMQGTVLQFQPAHISFFGSSYFGNYKERYIMLDKHKKSLLNSFLGLICFTLIASVVLTSSPPTVAQQLDPESGVDNGMESIQFVVSSLGEISMNEERVLSEDLGGTIQQSIAEIVDAGIIIQSEGADFGAPNNTTNPANVAIMAIMKAAREAGISRVQISQTR